MESSEITFDNLTIFIEDTEKLIIIDTPLCDNLDKLKTITEIYFKKYKLKSHLAKGIISTIKYDRLLTSKLNHLKSLLNECNKLIEINSIENCIIQENLLEFTKKSIIENRVIPLLEFLINEIELIINNSTLELNINEELFDLSDSSALEKIIMLDELGILEYLKNQSPFKSSVNLLANAISGITGIKSVTVQSYINPMFNENVSQKNNPRNSIKAVNRIKESLNKLGFIRTK